LEESVLIYWSFTKRLTSNQKVAVNYISRTHNDLSLDGKIILKSKMHEDAENV
jgi:hypothetical protein